MPTPQPLSDLLIARFPTAKRQTLRRMVADGRVRVNGRVAARYNQPVSPEDKLEIDERPGTGKKAQPAPRPRGPALNIVFEDADLLVVHKPPGLLTSTVPREPRPTLLAQVRLHVEQHPGRQRSRVGLIHRLDRDASGLLVFSKSDAAYQALKTAFFHHEVERVYHAIIRGHLRPPAGRIESRLVERTDGSVHSTRQFGKGEPAVTLYETIRTSGRLSLLRVTLETGRKHQIRVHLSESGCPIVGDTVYGPKDTPPPAKRLMLIATRLGLTHPRTGKRVEFELEVPGEFAKEMDQAAKA